MASGRRVVATGLACAVACGGLSGCVSTQRKNARAQLVAQRTLGGAAPLRVQRRDRRVRVTGVALVRGRHGGALVVALRNAGPRTVTDVPLAVGVVAAGGRRVQLNGGRELDWFRTHVPAIAAGERTLWMFAIGGRIPAGRPYAVAGAAGRAVAARVVGLLPRIAARATAAGGGGAQVTLVNRSDVPQYDVQVYALARAGGRIVAAGVAALRHLGSGARATVRVTLAGDPGRHAVRAHARPTIFE